MQKELTLQIILLKPNVGVHYGLQKGAGTNYETIQIQQSSGEDLSFKFAVVCKGEKLKDTLPKLAGPFVQGPANQKFIYIDIGQSAGQMDTCWSRRLKIPLSGITWEMLYQLDSNTKMILQTKVNGTGKDGGPNCATVKPLDGWQIISSEK